MLIWMLMICYKKNFSRTQRCLQRYASQYNYKYKLHYIYREFLIDFFRMDLNSLPKNASSLRFSKHNQHVMSLCLTYRVNLGLSLRKTCMALKDIHGISISHQQVANYCKTAFLCVKPFVLISRSLNGSTALTKLLTARPMALTTSMVPTMISRYGLLITTS